jgi:RND superfamily putative drug exporter
MGSSLGRALTRLRFIVIVGWIAAAAVALAVAPPLSKVGTSDETTLLPADAESVLARAVAARAFPDSSGSGNLIIVAWRAGGLTDSDRHYLADLQGWMTSAAAPDALKRVVRSVVSPESDSELASLLRSPDGVVELIQVQLSVASFQQEAHQAVDDLRAHITATAPAGLAVAVSGSAGISRDYLAAILAGTDRTTIATVALVIVVLLLIYRAPLAALVPLVTIGVAFLVARGILGWAAQAGWAIPTLTESFAVVLVFGVGTDYTIFLISRFEEELGGRRWPEAVAAVVGRIGTVITASAATVVVGLGSMVVARFGLVQNTGPALAIAIAVTWLAALTLTPSLLAVGGSRLFWPRRPDRPPEGAPSSSLPPAPSAPSMGATGRFWARLAGRIVARPALVAALVTLVLALPLVGLPGLRQNFDVIAELPADASSRVGYEAVAANLSRGQLLPLLVYGEVHQGVDPLSPAGLADQLALARRLAATPGVASVRSLLDPTGSGNVVADLRPSSRLAAMAEALRPAAPGTDPAAALRALTGAGGTLDSAGAYLMALGGAFPDVAAGPTFRTVVADLASLRQLMTATPGPEIAGRALGTLADLSAGLQALSQTFAARPDDLFLPTSLPGTAGEAARAAAGAYVAADRSVVRLYVVTRDEPYSLAAFATVRRLREALASPPAGFDRVLVGGPTAEFADVETTVNADFQRVAIITLVGIAIVLALLLRSLVAPLYLVASVLLSYGTTLGLSVLLFQHVLGQAGLNYFIPLMVFVLLVALGSDYNIFLMSRIREEAERRDLADGVRVASARTGAVITSAGLILAGTFAVLVSAPLLILVQVGTIVALGVLIDTFLVRSLLVPAVTALVGERAWWPVGRGGRVSPAHPRPGG